MPHSELLHPLPLRERAWGEGVNIANTLRTSRGIPAPFRERGPEVIALLFVLRIRSVCHLDAGLIDFEADLLTVSYTP